MILTKKRFLKLYIGDSVERRQS